MQRYVWETVGGTIRFRVTPDGGWVNYADAEAEIEKARQAGHMEGHTAGLISARALEQPIRADERERIRAEYKRLREDHLAAEAAELAMGEIETAQKPKPLEKLEHGADFETGLGLSREGVAKLNALVDAVNDLREVGRYAAGGTQVGKDIYLPNGGTWRRIQ